jgi:hypothetical protein
MKSYLFKKGLNSFLLGNMAALQSCRAYVDKGDWDHIANAVTIESIVSRGGVRLWRRTA